MGESDLGQCQSSRLTNQGHKCVDFYDSSARSCLQLGGILPGKRSVTLGNPPFLRNFSIFVSTSPSSTGPTYLPLAHQLIDRDLLEETRFAPHLIRRGPRNNQDYQEAQVLTVFNRRLLKI